MSNLNVWTLVLMRLSLAPLYVKREYSRLARRTGFGDWGTTALAAATTSAVAAAITLARGYSQEGPVLASVVLGFVLPAFLLTGLVCIQVPGGEEKRYRQKWEQLSALSKEYSELCSHRRAERDAARRRALEEQAQRSAQQEAERRAAEDLAKRQMAAENALASQRIPQWGGSVGSRVCWYCGQPVSVADVQCLCCRAVQV